MDNPNPAPPYLYGRFFIYSAIDTGYAILVPMKTWMVRVISVGILSIRTEAICEMR
jgi:hypothetical protein